MFSCNLPPALLAEWPGSFTCYCGNTGVERIPKLESAQKVDPGEENSPAAPTGIRDLSVTIQRSNHWAIPVPIYNHMQHECSESAWEQRRKKNSAPTGICGTFQSRVRRSNHWAIPVPIYNYMPSAVSLPESREQYHIKVIDNLKKCEKKALWLEWRPNLTICPGRKRYILHRSSIISLTKVDNLSHNEGVKFNPFSAMVALENDQ